MNLREYLIQTDTSISDFANLLNVSRPYMSFIVNGKAPGMKMAKLIHTTTGRLVKIEDLRKNAKPKKAYVRKNTKKKDVFEQFELPLGES